MPRWRDERMSDAMQKEYQTIQAMIALYCKESHKTSGGNLCLSCRDLLAYAGSRLDKCPFAESKPACADCTIHCYKPEMRREILKVMRYAGPRMIRSHPILAARHLLRKCQKPGRGKS